MKFPVRILCAAVGLLLVSCADTRHHIVVHTASQRMDLFDEGRPVATYPVSTSRFGLGDQPGSNCTPTVGWRWLKKSAEASHRV